MASVGNIVINISIDTSQWHKRFDDAILFNWWMEYLRMVADAKKV